MEEDGKELSAYAAPFAKIATAQRAASTHSHLQPQSIDHDRASDQNPPRHGKLDQKVPGSLRCRV